MYAEQRMLPRFRAGALAVLCAATGGLVSVTAAPAQAASYGSLRAAYDNTAISADTHPSAADLDGTGGSFSAADLDRAGWSRGGAATVNGTVYHRPDVAPGTPDNVLAAGQTVAVSGSGNALGFLAASAYGPVSGSGKVTYTDGTSSAYTLAVDDWSGVADTGTAVAVDHRNTTTGRRTAPTRLSAVTVPLDQRRTVASVTLPTIGESVDEGVASLHVFDISVRTAAVAPAGTYWAGSWATSFGSAPVVPQSPDWSRQTLRMVVHPNTTGGTARFRFANTFSPNALTLGHVTVATQASGAVPQEAPVSLTFGGSQSTTLAAGAETYSDAVAFPVTAGSNLLVSVYLPGPVTVAPVHSYALSTSYTSSRLAGDHTTDTGSGAFPGSFSFWTILNGVDVTTTDDIGTTVALGDSQTDGGHSTPNANRRWPDLYAAAINNTTQVSGVVNAGISANRLLLDHTDQAGPSALSRLDRDVFGQSNVRTLVIYEGINDIALDGASADALKDGIRRISAQARARGIRVVAATIPAFGGYSAYSDAKDDVRQQLNAWIRTTSDIDGRTDFDLATRDPDMPGRLLAGMYDATDDHLHFNDAGTKKLADTLAAGTDGVSVNMSQTTTGDFDGNGTADLVARDDADGTLQIWLNRGNGAFAAAAKVTDGWRPFSQTAAADFTGDGKADLVARDGSGNLKMWAGHGDGTFSAATQVTSGWDFTQTAAADFDGNGKADLIARDSAGNLKIWAGRGDGTFGAASQLSTSWDFTQTAGADFNGDGQADIVARDSAGNLKMWTHNAGGYFNAATQVTGGWNFSQTTAADSTGDGKADLVARDGSGNLKRWAGRGDGTFGAATVVTSGW